LHTIDKTTIYCHRKIGLLKYQQAVLVKQFLQIILNIHKMFTLKTYAKNIRSIIYLGCFY